jgi:hypothetical protein
VYSGLHWCLTSKKVGLPGSPVVVAVVVVVLLSEYFSSTQVFSSYPSFSVSFCISGFFPLVNLSFFFCYWSLFLLTCVFSFLLFSSYLSFFSYFLSLIFRREQVPL